MKKCKQRLEQSIVSAAKAKDIRLLFVSGQKQEKLPDDMSEKALKEKMQEIADAKAQIQAEVGVIRKMSMSQKQVADQLNFKQGCILHLACDRLNLMEANFPAKACKGCQSCIGLNFGFAKRH